MPSDELIRFGLFELDRANLQLRRKGHPVRLPQQPLRLLSVLLEKPGEVFTREELQGRLWEPGVFVDFDHGLNKAVTKLRETLGDAAESPSFIETVPRVGYRFIAPVFLDEPLVLETEPPSAAAVIRPAASSVPGRLRIPIWAWLAAIVFTTAGAWLAARHVHASAPIRSLAVLPLDNLSGDASQEYFADGMTDELVTELSHLPDIRVVSRTSVMREKGMHKSLGEIASDLGVDAVVEGSVARSANRVRITAQLIDTRSDTHLWAKTFEGSANDILSLQDDVARQIASEARLALGAKQEVRPASAARGFNPQAYDAYLRGRYFLEKRDARKSVNNFQQAISLAPEYAPAYAGFSQSWDLICSQGIEPHEKAAPLIIEAAQHAVALDPQSSDAYVALGWAELQYRWDRAAADRDLKRAIALGPSNADAEQRYAMYLDAMDRAEEAVTHMRKALQLDPLSFFKNRHMGTVLYYARHYDEALRYLDRASEMEPLMKGIVDHWRVKIYIVRGIRADAVRYDLNVLDTQLSPAEVNKLLSVYQHAGWEAYWRARMQAPFRQEAWCEHYITGNYAAVLRNADLTFSVLNQAIDHQCYWVPTIQIEPLFDFLRNDARYSELLKRVYSMRG